MLVHRLYNIMIDACVSEAVMSEVINVIMTFKYSGVIFNTLTVIVGSLIGLAFKKGIPKKLTDALMCAVGVCTVYIGIAGAVSAGSEENANPLIPILSVAVGVAVGTLLDIDGALGRLGKRIEKRIAKDNSSDGKLAEGFVSACLLFCVGSMTVVGGINAGVSSDNTLYFTKGVLDFVSSMALCVSLGAGVLFASVFVFVFQGALVLSATFIEPFLTPHMIAEMNCTGSLLILIIGLNLIGITKIKVADYLPSIVFATLLSIFI